MASLPLAETLAPRRRRVRSLWGTLWFVPVALLVWLGSGGRLPFVPDITPRIQGLITIFLSLFIEAFPFVLIGTLLSAAISLWVSDALLQRIVPRRTLPAALTGALLGLAFPVCERGTVPTTRRLLHKGAPLPFGVAFLLVAQVTQVEAPRNPYIYGGQ